MKEERQTPRYQGNAFTIFIERTAASHDGTRMGDILICKSVDLSAEGLQVVVDDPIPRGKVLRLCLDLHGKPPVFVVGEVMWERAGDTPGEYHIGFRLFESEQTDYLDWRKVLTELVDAERLSEESAGKRQAEAD